MAMRMRHFLGQTVSQLVFEPVPVRLRAYAGNVVALDSREAVLVWEPRRIVPAYAVPGRDIRGATTPADPQPEAPDLAVLPPVLGPENFEPHTTPGTVLDLAVGDRVLARAGFVPDDPDLDGLVVLDFASFGRWLAEDEELVGHPHDPYKRIDVLRSQRPVEVSLDGTTLADTDDALVLLETHLPPRYYLPPGDVDLSRLAPSDTHSTCAYKGHASYLSTTDGQDAGRDIAWTYPEPLDDALRVRDRIAFWNERTDIRVDGELQPRPVTPWSTPAEQAATHIERPEFG